MRPKISIIDIARKAKCNPTSVSQVLNGSPLPSARMRERVKKAAAELGYVPNRWAKALKAGRSGTLGIVMPYASETYYSAFLDAVSEEAAEKGYRLDIHFHRWSSEKEDQALRQLAEAQVEAAIMYVCRPDYKDAASAKWLKERGIPLLAINARTMTDQPFISSISTDANSGSYELGYHLGRLGHRRVDYFRLGQVKSCKTDLKSRSKIIGFEEGIKKATDNLGTISVFEAFAEDLIEDEELQKFGLSARTINKCLDVAVEKYFDQKSRGTAVFAEDEATALKILAAMQRRGLRCPEDLSVVCLATEGAGEVGTTPLTCVEFPIERMAEKAINILVAAIKNQKVARKITIPGTLVPRSSVQSLTECQTFPSFAALT